MITTYVVLKFHTWLLPVRVVLLCFIFLLLSFISFTISNAAHISDLWLSSSSLSIISNGRRDIFANRIAFDIGFYCQFIFNHGRQGNFEGKSIRILISDEARDRVYPFFENGRS